jgi:hypothetical protein
VTGISTARELNSIRRLLVTERGQVISRTSREVFLGPQMAATAGPKGPEPRRVRRGGVFLERKTAAFTAPLSRTPSREGL